MKTRIIHTKIHFEDDWFNTLSIEYRYLFIYTFTNSYIGHTGIYKISQRVILLETGATLDQWLKAKETFVKNDKIRFFRDWIYIKKAQKYVNYSGPKNELAFEKELSLIPEDVLKELRYGIDTVSYSIDTTINHKSKTINHNIVKTSKNSLIPCTEEELQFIAKDSMLNIKDVKETHQSILEKIEAKEFKHKTVYFTLRDWLRLNIKKGYIHKIESFWTEEEQKEMDKIKGLEIKFK